MELIQFMKDQVTNGKNTMNVNNEELETLNKLKAEGYLLRFNFTYLEDGTYDIIFVPTEKFKYL
ncbi:TPA: hypothetical protein SGA28_000504 [Staphylococcus aureus]|uniref:hypothetical protein n=1 Tax=Staphylococcus aureus TaxID=1280 RepID=UPI0005E0AD0C|nr:hypothetical protein [Staphylococcus aureus]UUV45324.1 hypothetical protein [Staphylococcus phage SAP3_TA-2022]APW51269.1 hypothetical protein LG33_09390 [Staphylococcus aureus]AQQ84388.1 hypothetical protein AYM13_09290 [Staphylococcus aureus]AQQ87315.1 hypothetical protein AYM14_09290 [Staphylococcus aureus]AQQ89381.1 hypothetical protein AYM15_04870 [Staphylococcus aureus]